MRLGRKIAGTARLHERHEACTRRDQVFAIAVWQKSVNTIITNLHFFFVAACCADVRV